MLRLGSSESWYRVVSIAVRGIFLERRSYSADQKGVGSGSGGRLET